MPIITKSTAFIVWTALVAIEGSMLTSDELAAILLVDGVGADCTIRVAAFGRNICGEERSVDVPNFILQACKLTSIILLLLVVVAKLAFSLRSHTSLSLHHLFRFTGPLLMALIGIEILQPRARLWPNLIRVVNGMVASTHSSNTRCLTIPLA